MTSRSLERVNAQPAYDVRPVCALVLAGLFLLLFGLVMVYSTSSIIGVSNDQSSIATFVKQAACAVVGCAMVWLLWRRFPARFWSSWRTVIVVWCISVLLIVATALFGTEEYGAKRWLYIGSLSLQPSEFAKIGIILMAAYQFDAYVKGEKSQKDFLIALGWSVVLPVAFLFITQSDLGTTMIIALGCFVVAMLSDIDRRVLWGVLFVGVVLGVLAVVTKSYRSDRLSVFLNPWNDGEGGYGTGYQLIHSWYALGEGGLFGVGPGNSHEKFLYLPFASTDFIFAVVGEEFGLVGATLVLVGFLVLLWGGLKIAFQSPDNSRRLIAGSLIVMLVFQAYLNIGCVIGFFPTTGKPLPLMSAGGTSLLASLLILGIVLSMGKPEETKPKTSREHKVDGNYDRGGTYGASRSYRGRNGRSYYTGAGISRRSS